MEYENLRKLYEIAFNDGANAKLVCGGLSGVSDEKIIRAIYLSLQEEKELENETK